MFTSKVIVITGGVVSALGKGIATASIGMLLKRRGYNVIPVKLDPYLNVDAGTMNPFQHGEVYVTDDGAETDMDLGHYERFLDLSLTGLHNITAGQVYYRVIENERKGEYEGKTVQVVPHLTDEIKRRILNLVREDTDIILAEIGGTVGDIESLPFLEAARQLKLELGEENIAFLHLTLVPFIKAAGELKTKPTQHSVMKLREIGLQPDVIVCRTERKLTKEVKHKIALFGSVPYKNVIEAKDVDFIYKVPVMFYNQGLDSILLDRLHLAKNPIEMDDWLEFIEGYEKRRAGVRLCVVGKYVELKDAYKSIIEAFNHVQANLRLKIEMEFIEAEWIEEKGPEQYLDGCDGILIPGGFGERGIEGKIEAIRYARENKKPFFGICLGMQLAIIEFARNVMNLKEAHSVEFDPHTPYPVIRLIPEQRRFNSLGGTLRKGAFDIELDLNSKIYQIYNTKVISERHRHRYEFNPEFITEFKKAGLKFTGFSIDRYKTLEAIELPHHPWFIAVQFHPEFKSRPLKPHPLFLSFTKAMRNYHGNN